MFKVFYGFTNPPFSKEVKPDNLFQHEYFKELIRRFEYIKKYRGIMLISGDPGTGKTTAIRYFISSLPEQLFHPVYIPLSTVGVTDFYVQLNHKLGGNEHTRVKSKLFESIQKRILELAGNKNRIPVIIIDECHFLKNDNFFELQIISNFNLDSMDPCIFILSAQSHLNERLRRNSLESFRQRISVRYSMEPLGLSECQEYILHAFRKNGVNDPIFTESGFKAIYNISGGVLRSVGNLVTKTLAHGSSSKKLQLSEEDVFVASKEL